MEYRRFGKTEKKISVLTLGGMRYKHVWDDPRDSIPNDTLRQAIEITDLAFKNGINHIETAHGYKKSEHLYGKVLNEELKIPRNSYYLMTKGAPKTAFDTRRMVESQLKALQTDYIDFYGWHGINNWQLLNVATQPNGPVEELLKLKNEGIIKHIGFSTHAPIEIIIKAIETDYFEFVNLHYYYFFQRNWGAIALANAKDMGVFIISPNDKGGKLYAPSTKVKEKTAPLTPIQWNAKFCLQSPEIHTLSFGFSEPDQFKESEGIFPVSVPMEKKSLKIKFDLDQQLLHDPHATFDGFGMQHDPSGINIPEVLRLRRLWKCYDMLEYGRYRYNSMKPGDSWIPGAWASEENLSKINLDNVPKNIPLIDMLREAHDAFYQNKAKSGHVKLPQNFKPVRVATR